METITVITDEKRQKYKELLPQLEALIRDEDAQLLSGSSTPMESMPVPLQYLMQTISPTPHFVAFAQAVLFRGADITMVWLPLVAMVVIGSVYFTFALSRFRRVIFGS